MKAACGLAVFLLMVMPGFTFAQGTGQSEQITLTTYYPSPYGVYKNLRLFPYAVTAGTTAGCNANMQGTLAYADNANGNKPLYCDGANWVAMGGGGRCKLYLLLFY